MVNVTNLGKQLMYTYIVYNIYIYIGKTYSNILYLQGIHIR